MTRSAVVFVLLLGASVVHAQGVGFVGGGSVDPEQFYAGTFFETPTIARNMHIRPGIDGGWGSGLRIASINFDLIYRSEAGTAWQFYTGGGPAILIIRVEDSDSAPNQRLMDDVTGGFSGVFGFSHQSGFLAEFKFANVRNGPRLRFGLGYKLGGP